MAKVHIRERKRKDGTIGLYLEIYKGYDKTDNGNTRAIRERKKLDFFLFENPKTPLERNHNKETRSKVEVLRGRVLDNILNKKHGFKSNIKNKLDFNKYFNKLMEERFESKGNYGNWDSSFKHFKAFIKGAITPIDSIDVEFCKSFYEYLSKEARKKNGDSLSSSSVSSYFNKFRAALNQAVDDELIHVNPASKVRIPKIKEKPREFLTEGELLKLYDVECRYDVLKRAFLFACLTGLRWSDVHNLKWTDVQDENGRIKIVFHQEKTEGLQYHYIPEDALVFMGEPKEGHERVFYGLRYSAYFNVALKQWILKAGIIKNITFHCARHTYACLLIEKDVDLYTVSKLLGHTDLKSTQIYAKILNKKKVEAIETLNIFGNER